MPFHGRLQILAETTSDAVLYVSKIEKREILLCRAVVGVERLPVALLGASGDPIAVGGIGLQLT